jgi:hypothetical protein
MKFIERDSRGVVIAAYSVPQYSTQASLREDDPALSAYFDASPLSRVLAEAGLTIDDVRQAATRTGLFVDRDRDGNVLATHERPLRDGHELASLADPSLQRFLAGEKPPSAPEGFVFTYNAAHQWRVTRLEDLVVVADNLETAAACADAADRLLNTRVQFQAQE